MNKIRYFLLFLAIPLLFSTCQKKEEEEEPKELIEFKLRLLNENLQESTEFKEGENIIFSFYIKNNTSEGMLITHSYFKEDFFRVYQLTNIGKGLKDFGKAYDRPSARQLPSHWTIPPKNMMEYKSPWVSTNNPNHYNLLESIKENHLDYLPKGTYYTEYESFFEFGINNGEGLSREIKKFKVEFTVN